MIEKRTDLTDTVYNAMVKQGIGNARQVAKRAKCSQSIAQMHMRVLHKEGKIDHNGVHGRGSLYMMPGLKAPPKAQKPEPRTQKVARRVRLANAALKGSRRGRPKGADEIVKRVRELLTAASCTSLTIDVKHGTYAMTREGTIE